MKGQKTYPAGQFGVSFMKNKSGAVAECRQRKGEDPAFEVANFTYNGTPEGDQVNVCEGRE